MQIKLDKWIYNPSEYNKTPYQYMYLEWHNKEPRVNWVKELPEKVNFKKIIKWKISKNYSIDINICGYLNNKSNKFIKYSGVNLKTTFLKSHLQKCIRRKIKNKALKTAFSLINKDIIEFLRRLPIIMIEDCSLHYSFSYIIWLMVAYPEYELKNTDINYLLQIVDYLSSTEYKDLLEKTEIPLLSYIEKLNSLKTEYLTILYSVGLRKSYGGLKGDMELLSSVIKKWIIRFDSNLPINTIVFNQINTNKFYLLNKNLLLSNKINYSAIDFHCFPGILSNLNTIYPEVTQDLFKKLIWDNISSINYRNIIGDKLELLPKKKISDYEINLWNNYRSKIISIIIKYEDKIYDL